MRAAVMMLLLMMIAQSYAREMSDYAMMIARELLRVTILTAHHRHDASVTA